MGEGRQRPERIAGDRRKRRDELWGCCSHLWLLLY
jgi:hypothetical protein